MIKYSYGIPSYLRCPECGQAMKGEVTKNNFGKFIVWCPSLPCQEYEVKYETDAPQYPLRKVE